MSSVSFYEKDSTRKTSGSPGYIKGKPIKVGTKVVKNSKTYVEEPVDGFYLRGANNKGECVNEKDGKALLEYLEDPQLTFDDSILYGCHVDMNYKELQNFCVGNKQNSFQLF